MANVNPLLLVGAVIGVVTALLVLACALVKDKKETMGFERTMNDGEILRRLAGYAKPYLAKFVVVLFLMLFSIAYDIISPLIVGALEELVSGEFELPRLFAGVAVYAGVLVFSMASTYFQAVILQRVGQRIISDLREDLFTHIESLSHEQLNEIPVGKLVTRVTNDTNAISMMFTNLLVTLTKNIFVILGILVAMLALNYELTLMVLCFVPFIMLFSIIFRKFSRRAHRKVKDCTTDINTYLSENLSGMKITQIFNREDAKMREFTDKSNALGRAQQEQIFVFGIFRPLVYMLYISSVLCLLYLGGKGYLEGTSFLGQTLTSGMIVSFYMYISKFFNPIQNLAEQFNWLQSAFASAEKVFSILDLEPKMQDAPDAIELTGIRGEIEFRDVWFSYIPGEWVLKGVSFHVNPKETIAFVGSTGSGKSTILSLICRNYEFQKGEILIDGIDIRKIKIDSLRKKFGQMLQDVFLFSGTIRSNIILREEGISDEEIMDVCHYVNADQFINKLDHGLDEPVRERGNNFSAGQRQQNSAVAYFFPDLCNGSLGVVAHSPVTGAAADLFQETVQHGQTILGVVYLRVELYGIQFLFRIFHGSHRAVLGMCCDGKALRCLGDVVGVAHPGDRLFRQFFAAEQSAGLVVDRLGLAVFRSGAGGDCAAQGVCHQLTAVADAQDRDAHFKDFLGDMG